MTEILFKIPNLKEVATNYPEGLVNSVENQLVSISNS